MHMKTRKKTPPKHRETARSVFRTEIEGLQSVCRLINESFDNAIEAILEATSLNRKVIVTGIGKNLPVAEKIAATFSSTGTPAVVLNPVQAMHGDLGIAACGDVLLALSYSGESDELNGLLPCIRQMRVKIISITGVRNSSMAKFSDIVIMAPVTKEACPFNMAPTSSTTAALVMGDAMAIALMKYRNFQKSDYAKLHPGGAIGRTLVVRVADIMRTGRRLATVKAGSSVKSAMLAMTSARSGSVGVVDSQRRLLGIITDGDLRRHFVSDPAILERPAAEVMTRSPSTVSPDQLAADVLHIFETHSFDDLPVVDEKGRLVGSIDIQDLPKLKML